MQPPCKPWVFLTSFSKFILVSLGVWNWFFFKLNPHNHLNLSIKFCFSLSANKSVDSLNEMKRKHSKVTVIGSTFLGVCCKNVYQNFLKYTLHKIYITCVWWRRGLGPSLSGSRAKTPGTALHCLPSSGMLKFNPSNGKNDLNKRPCPQFSHLCTFVLGFPWLWSHSWWPCFFPLAAEMASLTVDMGENRVDCHFRGHVHSCIAPSCSRPGRGAASLSGQSRSLSQLSSERLFSHAQTQFPYLCLQRWTWCLSVLL